MLCVAQASHDTRAEEVVDIESSDELAVLACNRKRNDTMRFHQVHGLRRQLADELLPLPWDEAS